MEELCCFDGKAIRLTDSEGLVFDGECQWHSAEYCQAELGPEEEALQIDDWVFYQKDIRSVVPREGEPSLWLSRPQHRMRLAPEPFRRMEKGEKTVELRLWDEKRRKIRPGDIIRFESTEDDTDILRAEVTKLCPFGSFAELYRCLPLTECGYRPEELPSASPKDMERYYTPAEQLRWGVVAIRLKLL